MAGRFVYFFGNDFFKRIGRPYCPREKERERGEETKGKRERDITASGNGRNQPT